jgi:succinyl-CoA synthetase alpha subunit
MTRAGIGQSTWIGIGGDPIRGLSFRELLEMFAVDPETRSVLLVGEIGGADEELAADYLMQGYDKPVVAYIAGRSAPKGKQMGHAGAIVKGDVGEYETKIKKLRQAKVSIANEIDEAVDFIKQQTAG